MTEDYRDFLMLEYAKKVAKSESMDFTKGYYKNKIKDLAWYNQDKELMKKHQRFLNYIYSTFEKYIIHRNIIIYFYEKIPCSISVLNNTVNISRTALTRIINDSIEEKWLFTKINKDNKKGESVILKKGDDVLQFKNKTLTIKIDVEGFEFFVLKGLKKNLINNSCVLQIEIWEKNNDEVHRFLSSLGYRMISSIDGLSLIHI
mgnify:CR=1 FL=1